MGWHPTLKRGPLPLGEAFKGRVGRRACFGARGRVKGWRARVAASCTSLSAQSLSTLPHHLCRSRSRRRSFFLKSITVRLESAIGLQTLYVLLLCMPSLVTLRLAWLSLDRHQHWLSEAALTALTSASLGSKSVDVLRSRRSPAARSCMRFFSARTLRLMGGSRHSARRFTHAHSSRSCSWVSCGTWMESTCASTSGHLRGAVRMPAAA